MFRTWVKQVFPNRTFEQNFDIEHEFHGIVQHHISETFRIKPITSLGIQLLLDGIQITDPSLHLKSRIIIKSEYIQVCLTVIDPTESESVLFQLKRTLVKQLLDFEKRFYSSPIVQYVEPFCNQCMHFQTKPLNQCISSCQFQPKKQANSKELAERK